jgi:hypothetical protein
MTSVGSLCRLVNANALATVAAIGSHARQRHGPATRSIECSSERSAMPHPGDHTSSHVCPHRECEPAPGLHTLSSRRRVGAKRRDSLSAMSAAARGGVRAACSMPTAYPHAVTHAVPTSRLSAHLVLPWDSHAIPGSAGDR